MRCELVSIQVEINARLQRPSDGNKPGVAARAKVVFGRMGARCSMIKTCINVTSVVIGIGCYASIPFLMSCYKHTREGFVYYIGRNKLHIYTNQNVYG